jgi:hypothetical protein
VAELLAEISQSQTMIMDLKTHKQPAVEVEDVQILPKFSEEELESLKADHEQERDRLQY